MNNEDFGKEVAKALVLITLIIIVVVAALSGAAYSNIGQLDQQSKMEMSQK